MFLGHLNAFLGFRLRKKGMKRKKTIGDKEFPEIDVVR